MLSLPLPPSPAYGTLRCKRFPAFKTLVDKVREVRGPEDMVRITPGSLGLLRLLKRSSIPYWCQYTTLQS